MIYMLDTNAFSDLMRRNAKSIARLQSLGPQDRIAICTVVRGEILYGLGRLPHGAKRSQLETKASELFQAIVCEPIPQHAGDQYAQAKLDCERKGLPLDDNDLWIAAASLELNATVVTRDQAFSRVAGLRVEDWTA